MAIAVVFNEKNRENVAAAQNDTVLVKKKLKNI